MRREVPTVRSGTSSFNRHLYINALSRFWAAGLAYTAVWVYDLLQTIPKAMLYTAYTDAASLLRTALFHGGTLCFLGAGGMAMCVFSWLYFPRQTAFMTALPARREAVFLSHAAAGFTLLEAGNVLTVLVCALLGRFAGIETKIVFEFLCIITLLTVFFFGFACFCATLTGSIVILPAVYAVLLYAAVALEASLRRIAQFLVFGLMGQRWKLTIFSPVYYLRIQGGMLVETVWVSDPVWGGRMGLLQFRGWPVIIGYAGAGVAFAALAVALLRSRAMENAGAVVAVPALRGAFRWCAALAGALSMGLMALQVVFGYSGEYSVTGSFPNVLLLLFLMLVGAFLGWFGAQGLLRKSLKVFDRGWGGFAAVCAVICVLTIGCEMDLLGVEKRLPDPGRVSRVELYDTMTGVGPTALTQPQNIAAAVEMHKTIVENKALFESQGTGYSDGGILTIKYYDWDGQLLMTRGYAAHYGPAAWSSAGNAWVTAGSAMVSWGDVQPVFIDGFVTWGDAYATYGDAYASDGDAYASDGNSIPVWSGRFASDDDVIWVPCGSLNPALPMLEALINSREAVMQRLTTDGSVSASALTAQHAYAYWQSDYIVQASLDIDSADAWELYHECVLPDAEDSTIGWVFICPSWNPAWENVLVNLGFGFARQTVDDYDYAGVNLTVPADAVRTNNWLLSHGLEIPGREMIPTGEEPVSADPGDVNRENSGLSELLDLVWEEYDPAAAGTVVSVRWARRLLDWYASVEEDGDFTRLAAAGYARSRVLDKAGMADSLEKLRTAGLQLASGELGLVRDRNGRSWSADTVNDLFDALESALC